MYVCLAVNETDFAGVLNPHSSQICDLSKN